MSLSPDSYTSLKFESLSRYPNRFNDTVSDKNFIKTQQHLAEHFEKLLAGCNYKYVVGV